MTPTPKTPEMIIHMFSALEVPARELSTKQLDLIGSFQEQFEERQSLSDRQFEILEDLYARHTD